MITISGEIAVDSEIPGVDAERLGPFTIQVDRDGSIFRQKLTLPAGVWTTPNIGDAVPWLFLIVNIGAAPVAVGFGQGEPILIDVGGPPASWTGSQVPSMKAVGAAGAVLILVITAAA